jgi:hypothetical protein
MRNTTIHVSLLFVFIFAISIFAQEKKEQQDQKIELPELYLEQKLDRAVGNWTVIYTVNIAYAKSLGQKPEDYGMFLGEAVAPSWEGIKGEGISPFIEGLYKNFQTDVNCNWEILNESEKSVTVKMNRFGEEYVKEFADSGVSVKEYDKCSGKLLETIANYLGFEFEQELKEDWIVFTVSKK